MTQPPLETLMVICPQCGGQGGEPESNFDWEADPMAWHPCYFCNAEGKLPYSQSLYPEE